MTSFLNKIRMNHNIIQIYLNISKKAEIPQNSKKYEEFIPKSFFGDHVTITASSKYEL